MLMIAGLLRADRGHDPASTASACAGPQTDIGIMFQDNTLVPWRTVRGNVELQLELRGLIAATPIRERIDELLASVRPRRFRDRYPYELSGGMQQRAAFCQAMVHEPETCCSTSRWASSTR